MKRWLSPWKDSSEKPSIYHVVSRIVDRRKALGDAEKSHFLKLMRMIEGFSGCLILAYCIMGNHFHILLEVPPMPAEGISDTEFESRLLSLYPEGTVAEVMTRLNAARSAGNETLAQEIIEAYTYRMHDLSEFMKTLLQRYTRWHNRQEQRSGVLWESRFLSVLVEDGAAARVVSSYIDLNPVRAGLVKEPLDYLWSSYSEAVGAVNREKRDRARAGLVRMMLGHDGVSADAELWDSEEVSKKYRQILMQAIAEKKVEVINAEGQVEEQVVRKGMTEAEILAAGGEIGAENEGGSGEIPWTVVLRCRCRHFTVGAVIGSQEFVEAFYRANRESFGSNRKTGARKFRGAASAVNGVLRCLRDLRKDVGESCEDSAKRSAVSSWIC